MINILIVDDSDLGRMVTEAMLISPNFSFIFAIDGQDAFEKVLNQKPDLVILDVMMPFIDGIDVTRMIRRHAEIKNTPIIITTALDDRETRTRALKAGANDVVVKPLNKIKLLSTVNKILDETRTYNK